MTDKFNLTIRGSTHTNLTKRELAYQVFAEAIRRGITLDRLRKVITSKSPNRAFVSVPGRLNEREFIKEATRIRAESGHSFNTIKWFSAGAKLIYAEGQTVAFTNQWGHSTVEMVSLMKKEMKGQDISFELAGPFSDTIGGKL